MRNRERQQNNLCRRKLHSLTRTSLSQPPINQSSPQTILRFRSLITFRRLPRRSFMLIPWTHWISNVGPAILVPRTNLNKRFPLTTHPRVLLRAISPFSSRIHTPFRRVSHPFLRSLGRCWTIEGVGWPRLLDQNEFEALTEADSRLTSRRSNYRIFIRTHSPDGQLLYRRVKANPIREKEREREREKEMLVLNVPRDLVGGFPRSGLQSAPARKITPRQLSRHQPLSADVHTATRKSLDHRDTVLLSTFLKSMVFSD